MLQIAPEEQLSASACLKKGCDLQLFNSHSLNSESATPTQQTVAQGENSDDNGSTIILLGALWDMDWVSSNHDDNSWAGHHTLKHTSVFLKFCNLWASSSSSGHSSQLESFGTGFEHQGSNFQSLVNHLCPLETGSKYLEEYKWLWSRAVSSANKSFSREWIKYQLPENLLTQIPISHTDRVSN